MRARVSPRLGPSVSGHKYLGCKVPPPLMFEKVYALFISASPLSFCCFTGSHFLKSHYSEYGLSSKVPHRTIVFLFFYRERALYLGTFALPTYFLHRGTFSCGQKPVDHTSFCSRVPSFYHRLNCVSPPFIKQNY